jgi:hypothetical protein
MDPAAQATFDYAQKVSQQTGETGLFGNIFATVNGLDGAMQAGQFAVDGDTAKVINDKLSSIQDIVLSARANFVGNQGMPIGGGYAQQISQRNDVIASGGAGSAAAQLQAFAASLDSLKQAINSSVTNYHGAEQDAHQNVNRAGS